MPGCPPPAPPLAHPRGQEEDLGVVPPLEALPALPVVPEQVSPGKAIRRQRHDQGHPLPAGLGGAERGLLGRRIGHGSGRCRSRFPQAQPGATGSRSPGNAQSAGDGVAALRPGSHRGMAATPRGLTCSGRMCPARTWTLMVSRGAGKRTHCPLLRMVES